MKASSSAAVSDAGVTMVLPVSGHIPHSRRQRISENIPTHEQLMAIKHKKKVSQDSCKFLSISICDSRLQQGECTGLLCCIVLLVITNILDEPVLFVLITSALKIDEQHW